MIVKSGSRKRISRIEVEDVSSLYANGELIGVGTIPCAAKENFLILGTIFVLDWTIGKDTSRSFDFKKSGREFALRENRS